jgi:hypothetical protein
MAKLAWLLQEDRKPSDLDGTRHWWERAAEAGHATSFIWEWGNAGCGPRRLRDICYAAEDRLEPSLQRALDAVNKDPASPDPIAGYACLYGGYDDQDRVPADLAFMKSG